MKIKTLAKGIVVLLLVMIVVGFAFASDARAEYINGDVIFAEDLPVGAILTGFTVSGNGANNVAREAVVVQSGQSPRLVLTSNHGLDSVFGSDNNYNTSTLKSKIDSLSFSIAAFITNVSAPSVIDVTDGNVFLQELRTGTYWTRSPHCSSAARAFYVYSSGSVSSDSVSSSCGVRPAFNLKSDTVLRYENGKFRITTDPNDYQAAHYRKYGDLYSAADAARTAAVDAKNAANTAASNASNAYNAANAAKSSADAAKTSADTAAARVWDSTESKSAATLAKEARDKANQALTQINNVKTVVNNLQSSVTPQIQKISGLNGATCTKTTSFTVVVQASGATQYRVKLDNGSWGSWTAMGTPTTVTVSTTGAHTVYVEIQNASGATASGHMTFFKI